MNAIALRVMNYVQYNINVITCIMQPEISFRPCSGEVTVQSQVPVIHFRSVKTEFSIYGAGNCSIFPEISIYGVSTCSMIPYYVIYGAIVTPYF